MKETDIIRIDPNDWDGMLALMERADEFHIPYMGNNNEGELIQIKISHDNISVDTYQQNGRIRRNIYYKDHTSEELFEGRWR